MFHFLTDASSSSSGALFILDHYVEDISSPLKSFRTFYWPNSGLLDVAWSESSENILWSSSADGFIQIWDLNSYINRSEEEHDEDPLSEFEPSPDPIKVIKVYEGNESKSINCIKWSYRNSVNAPSLLSSSSCDHQIKLWDTSMAILKTTFHNPDHLHHDSSNSCCLNSPNPVTNRKLSLSDDLMSPSSSTSTASFSLVSSPSSTASSSSRSIDSSPSGPEPFSFDGSESDGGLCDVSSSDGPDSPSSFCLAEDRHLRVSKCCLLPSSSMSKNGTEAICWSPLDSSCFASVSSDGYLNTWDIRCPNGSKSIHEVKCFNHPLTSVDWSHFDPNLIIVSSIKGFITGFDLRSSGHDIFTISGHRKPVTQVKLSRHESSIISSSSTDGTIKIWNFKHDNYHFKDAKSTNSNNLLNVIKDESSNHLPSEKSSPSFRSSKQNHLKSGHLESFESSSYHLMESFNHHQPYCVKSFDFNQFNHNQLVDCSSDSLIFLYSINSSPPSAKLSAKSRISSSSSSPSSTKSQLADQSNSSLCPKIKCRRSCWSTQSILVKTQNIYTSPKKRDTNESNDSYCITGHQKTRELRRQTWLLWY